MVKIYSGPFNNATDTIIHEKIGIKFVFLRDSLREFLLPPLCMSVILSVNIKSHKVLNDR